MPVKQEVTRGVLVVAEHDNTRVEGEFDARIDNILGTLGKAYDCATEQEPSLAAYHPSFRCAEDACHQISSRITDLFQGSDYEDDETRQLLADVKMTGTVAYPALSRVGLIGDSGVGKSSLANSLLHSENLALEGSSGSACTQVITEYRMPWPGQPTPFQGEVEFYEPTARYKMLRSYVNDYYNYVHSSGELEDEASQDLEARYSAASEIFQALFCNRTEFQRQGTFDDEAVQEYIKSAESPNKQAVTQKFFQWTRELLAEYSFEECIASRSANTAEELSGLLEVFLKTVGGDGESSTKPSLWPLVQVIRSDPFHSRPVMSGLTVVDLPGLSDVNHVRKGATQCYMKKCSFIILVANIARAQTDETTNKRLMSKIGALGCKKTLVCTGADLHISLTKKFDIHQFAPKAEASQEYNRMTSVWNKWGNDMRALEKELPKLGATGHKYVSDLITALRLRRKALGTLRTEAVASMRSKKVISGMRDRYSKAASDRAPLTVICVSNLWYGLHQQGYDDEEIPCSVEASGIPNLRRECLALLAASKLNILAHHVNVKLPGVLNSLDSWSNASTIKRREEIRCIVAKPLEEYEAEIRLFVAELGIKLRGGIMEQITERYDQWVKAGKETLDMILKTYKASAFKEWCMKDGAHATKIEPFASWNAQFLKPVVDDLTKEFARHDATMDMLVGQCSTGLCELVNKIRNDIKVVRGLSITAMEPFMMSLDPAKHELRNLTKKTLAQLLEDSRKVRLNTITEDNDGYFMRVMLPLYGATRAEKGPKSHQRRCAILRNAMSSGSPFSIIGVEVSKDMLLAYDRAQARVLRGARATFEKVLRDFDRRFVVKEIRNPRRDQLRKQMKELVDGAKVEIDGSIVVDLARAQTETSG
ncbi:MAG: hypothetical protein Q9191_005893 [Dirinaria sp. TL-2023a]